jgi:hypothetical protein
VTGSIWDILGVAPGSDRETIRRAYARELRQTNPEDDPDGFQRLRAAYETALRLASAGPNALQPTVGVASPDPDPSPAPPPSTTESAAASEANAPSSSQAAPPPAPRRDIERLAEQLRQALLPSATPDVGHAKAALEVFLSHPDLDNLSARIAAESRLSRLLATNIPRSDPLLNTAINYFGWRRGDVYDQRPEILALLNRDRSEILERPFAGRDGDTVTAPVFSRSKHPLYQGWRALTATDPKAQHRRWAAFRPGLRRQIAILLNHVRQSPKLRSHLAPDAEAWWRRRLGQPQPEAALAVWPMTTLQVWALLLMSAPEVTTVGFAEAMILGAAGAIAYTYRFTPWISRLRQKTANDWTWPAATVAMLFLPAASMFAPNLGLGSVPIVVLACLALAWRAAQPIPVAPHLISWQKSISRAILLVIILAPIWGGGGGIGSQGLVAALIWPYIWVPNGSRLVNSLRFFRYGKFSAIVIATTVTIGLRLTFPGVGGYVSYRSLSIFLPLISFSVCFSALITSKKWLKLAHSAVLISVAIIWIATIAFDSYYNALK